MKSIFSTILIFLISLPTCGMVFSGELNTMGHHSHEEIWSVDMDHMDGVHHQAIQSWIYECCPNASKGILERNIIAPFSLENISTNISYACIFSHIESVVSIWEYPIWIYRPDSPPDPSEYISLVWSSVKNLN